MKRNTEELKEKLISVGIEEIRTNGIDRMSMRTIAQKCGVTHGAPYKHFGSKDRYIQVVMEHLSMFFLTNMIQGILELVKQEMGIEFDEESLHYERFVTHLKFLAQRLYRHELLKDEEIEFARMMENKYPKEYECSKHIAEYIEKEYGSGIASEEIMFLAIHIKRVCMAG